VVSLRGIAKSFGATRAVDGVDLDLITGEVHGLIGENGAGKSTLMRVLAGFFPDYDGTIAIAGREVDIDTPAQAHREGIALVHQELSLLPELTVAENIFLGREPRGFLPGFVSFSLMTRKARAVLAECGIGVDPSTRVDHLSIAERQLVEIVKGEASTPRVLILDEPTQGVDVAGRAEIHARIAELARSGVAILLISSDSGELLALADRVTVLRRGRVAGTLAGDDLVPERVLALALGVEGASS
jgi:ribose transport system ATP-binding protein